MTNQPASGDQNIIITYILKADETIQKAQEIRAKIDLIKAKMKEVAEASKTSFGDVAKAMKEAAKVEMTAKLKEMEAELKKLQEQYRAMKVATQADKDAKLADIAAQKNAIQGLKAEYKSLTGEITTAKTELTKEAGGAGGGGGGGIMKMLGIGSLGQLAGIAAGLFGITSAVQVLRQAWQFLMESAKAAKEFTQSLFALSVGVRALQRAGVEITMGEMSAQIDTLKKKFGVFSRVDLVEGSAAFINLNRDMGFTKDQLFELQDAIATLAIVNGRSMDEVQKTVALAISSGYTEGLQRLGVSINRVTIAEEAARLGWEGGYTALNEQQRALATYNLVIRKTAIYQEDLLEYQKTLPGQIDTTTKAIQDQTVAWGENFQGVLLWINQVKLAFLEAGTAYLSFLNTNAQAEFQEGFLKQQEERLGRILTLEEKIKYTQIAYDLWVKGSMGGALSVQQIFERYQIPSPTYNPMLGNVPVSEIDKEKQAIQAIVEKNLDDMEANQKDFDEGMKDLELEYERDLEQMKVEHFRRLEELELEHNRRLEDLSIEHQRRLEELSLQNNRKLADIQEKYERDVEDANAKYAQDVAQVWSQYYGQIADAQAKYENQQWKAEQDFQEKMRRLREGFMFDLEDALRERDARQVMNLIKKYKLDKDQLQREYDATREQNWRNFQLQLADLARQRDERLAQLAAELRARLAQLQLNAEREREDQKQKYIQQAADEETNYQDKKTDEETRYEQDKIDEQTRYDQDRADRLLRYQQDEADLRTHWENTNKEIAAKLAEQITATDTSMETLRKVLNDTLGPGGEAESIINYYKALLASAYMMYIPMIQNTSPTPTPTPTPGGHATGGTMIANRPTKATFGEGGWEMAQFIPLTRPMIPKLETNIAGPMISGNGGGNSRLKVEIVLDKYLEGRIIDTTMDQVADVIIKRLQ